MLWGLSNRPMYISMVLFLTWSDVSLHFGVVWVNVCVNPSHDEFNHFIVFLFPIWTVWNTLDSWICSLLRSSFLIGSLSSCNLPPLSLLLRDLPLSMKASPQSSPSLRFKESLLEVILRINPVLFRWSSSVLRSLYPQMLLYSTIRPLLFSLFNVIKRTTLTDLIGHHRDEVYDERASLHKTTSVHYAMTKLTNEFNQFSIHFSNLFTLFLPSNSTLWTPFSCFTFSSCFKKEVCSTSSSSIAFNWNALFFCRLCSSSSSSAAKFVVVVVADV